MKRRSGITYEYDKFCDWQDKYLYYAGPHRQHQVTHLAMILVVHGRAGRKRKVDIKSFVRFSIVVWWALLISDFFRNTGFGLGYSCSGEH